MFQIRRDNQQLAGMLSKFVPSMGLPEEMQWTRRKACSERAWVCRRDGNDCRAAACE
jgi:hypothetical protein